jgi:integrase
MASVSKDKCGNFTVQFIGVGRRRRTIWLGQERKRTVDTVKSHVEELVAAQRAGRAPYDETSDWLRRIGDSPLYDKLARVGLVPKRAGAMETTLAAFLDSYIAGRSDVKGSTVHVYGHTRRCLVEFFGADKALDQITPGDADDWRRWLGRAKNADDPKLGGQGLSDNTARRRCGIARQFFRDAVRRRLIRENPFGDMKGVSVLANRGRDYFVGLDDATKVLKACPDSQWQLLFALSRYAGLRCLSEHLALTWRDVDFDTGRIVVRSPKTEHHAGKATRVVPMFPELRPYLEAVRDEANPGIDAAFGDPVITRYRDTNANLRTQLERIIEKAGLAPWPKLFQNLRASCATELARKHPGHVPRSGWGTA